MLIVTGLLLVGFINFILGIMLFRQAQKGEERWIFLVMLVADAIWAWGIAFLLIASSLERAQIYVNIYYIAALTIAAAILAYSLYGVGIRRRVTYMLIAVPVMFWAYYLTVAPRALVDVISLSGSLNTRVVVEHGLYEIYAITFLLMTIPAFGLFYYAAAKVRGAAHERKLLLANGIVISGAFGVVFNLLLPGMGVYELIGLGPLFSIIFTMAVTYSIVRYSFFDLRQSFMRSLSYILTFIVAIVLYSFLMWFVTTALTGSLEDPQTRPFANGIMLVIVSMIFEPTRRFFNAISDKMILRKEYGTQDVLDKIGDIVSEFVELEPLSTKLLTVLRGAFKSKFVQIVLLDKAGTLQYVHQLGALPYDIRADLSCFDGVIHGHRVVVATDRQDSPDEDWKKIREFGVALVVRLRTTSGISGGLFIGEKRTKSPYNQRDIDLLSVAANEISLAVENSLRYEEIKSFNETLEQKITEATTELRTTNKKLRAMDQAKDEFISLTSHQLRTPLTTIKGYLSMLMDGDAGEVTPAQRKLIEEAFNSSQRMVHLISDFLNISRIQTGKFMLEMTEANLADVLSEEIELLQVSAKSKNITLEYKRPNNFPTMQVDEGKIRQVMMNFIDNSLYYSPSGTKVRVTLVHTSQFVEFRVIDQGIGVPKAEQHKLFAKFSRASNAKRQRPDGTGIGLFMAKKVIVALGGSIIFKSEEGKGSTFGFRLNRDSPNR